MIWSCHTMCDIQKFVMIWDKLVEKCKMQWKIRHHASLTTGSNERQITTQLQKKHPMHCTKSLLAPFTYKLIKASGRSRTSERGIKCASSQDQKRLEPVIAVISKAKVLIEHTMHTS